MEKKQKPVVDPLERIVSRDSSKGSDVTTEQPATTRKWQHSDPSLVYPAQTGGARGELRLRFVEKRCELDLIVPINDGEIGWTFKTQRAELNQSPESVAKNFSLEGNRFFFPLTKGVDALPAMEKVEVDAVAVLDEPVVEFGLQTPTSHEYFISKSGEAAGRLTLARGMENDASVFDAQPWLAQFIDSKFIPNAVLKGAPMPPDGVSALPLTLEKVIPAEFRYWEQTGDEARKCRDALIASSFFKSTAMAVVDGELAPVTTTYKLFEPVSNVEPASDWVLRKAASLLREGEGLLEIFSMGADALAKVSGEGLVAYVDAGDIADGTLGTLAKSLAAFSGEYVVTSLDSPGARAVMKSIGRPFQFRPGDGVGIDAVKRLFVASFGVRGDDLLWIDKVEDGDLEGAPQAAPRRKDPKLTEVTPMDDTPDVGKGAEFNNPDHSGEVRAPFDRRTQPDEIERGTPVNHKKSETQEAAAKSDWGTGEMPPLMPAVGFDVAANPKIRPKPEEDDFKERMFKVAKKGTDGDEHYVLGIVLEPDVVDAQNDTYSADEVRNAAHRYMAEFQNRGLMHKEIVNGKVDLLENYLAPVDMVLEGQAIKKGTWLMAMRVKDAKLWEQCKTGGLGGFSIGGNANRQPDPEADAKHKSAGKGDTKKSVSFQGIPIIIDRPKGFVQRGVDKAGKAWERTYKTDYGYIPGTKGGDDDDLDVYLGPDGNSPFAYWVTQKKGDGSFDEYKLFLGYSSQADARKTYEDHTPKKYFQTMHEGTVHQIKALLNQTPKEKLTKSIRALLSTL